MSNFWPAVSLLVLAATEGGGGPQGNEGRRPTILLVPDDRGHGEGGIRVPALVRRPGEVTALPDPYLFGDLSGKTTAVHGRWELVGEVPNHHGKFAVALPRIREARFSLYDLDAALGEARDLAPERPAVYQDLRDRQVCWFSEATREGSEGGGQPGRRLPKR